MEINAKIRKRDSIYTDINIYQGNGHVGTVRVPNTESDLWLILLNDSKCMDIALEILCVDQEAKLKAEKLQQERNDEIAKGKRELIAKVEEADARKAEETKATVLLAEAEADAKRREAEVVAADAAKSELADGDQDGESTEPETQAEPEGNTAEGGDGDGVGSGSEQTEEADEQGPDEYPGVAIDEAGSGADMVDPEQVGSEKTPQSDEESG